MATQLETILEGHGLHLQEWGGGYFVMQDSYALTWCRDLVTVEALFVTNEEVEAAAKAIARDLKRAVL